MNDIHLLDSPSYQNGCEQLENSPIHKRMCGVSTSKDEVDIEKDDDEGGEIGALDAGEESVVIVYS